MGGKGNSYGIREHKTLRDVFVACDETAGADVGSHSTCGKAAASAYRVSWVDQDAGVEHTLGVDRPLSGAQRCGKQLRPLLVVPRTMVAADGMMMGDGA